MLFATGLHFLSGWPLWLAACAVVGVTFAMTCLCLLTLAMWTRQAGRRLGRFGIRFVLLLTLSVAVFMAIVRQLAELVAQAASDVSTQFTDGGHASRPPDLYSFLFASLAALCVTVAFGIPVMICMLEAVVWFGVWLIRMPFVQWWLRRRRN